MSEKRKTTKNKKSTSKTKKKTDQKEKIKVSKEKINLDEKGSEKIDEKNQGKQEESHQKILKFFLVFALLSIIFVLALSYMSNYKQTFNYRGVKFEVVSFCDAGPPCLITYNTKIPYIKDGRNMLHNFYLRKDPRKLEQKVDFNGELIFKENMFVNIEFDKYCEGHETIAVANFANLFNFIGISTIGDVNSTCENSGNNMHVLIKEGQKTKIEQIQEACYEITIKDCEILEGTERFMNEVFVKIN